MSENTHQKSPAFQFYPADWLSSPKVALMTPAEEGAYIRLLSYDWSNDGIPDDDAQLAALSRLGEGWLNSGSTVVKKCFEPHPRKDGFLTNRRLEKERLKQQNWRNKSRIGGQKSAENRRKQAKIRHTQDESKGGSRVVQPKGNSSSSSSSSSSESVFTRTQEIQSSDAEIPTLEGVKTQAQFLGVSEDSAIRFWEHHEGNGLWLNQHNRLINWKIKLKVWGERDRQKPTAKGKSNLEHEINKLTDARQLEKNPEKFRELGEQLKILKSKLKGGDA